jgi:hypothetical protein
MDVMLGVYIWKVHNGICRKIALRDRSNIYILFIFIYIYLLYISPKELIFDMPLI